MPRPTAAVRPPAVSRRTALTTAAAATAAALSAKNYAFAHARGNDEIRIALVGCGGRGTGAAADALSVPGGRTKLVAMADVFAHRLDTSRAALEREFPGEDRVDVPEDRRFAGFAAFGQAMDALSPGDVVILATPPAFRWVHFAAAIERGLHVFMEKPISVDGPSTRRMLELNGKARAAGLKVGVGLMCRHGVARNALFDRIRGGEIGELNLLRAYRCHGPVASCFVEPKPEGEDELLWQIRNFHGFLWAGGGSYSDFLIHNIDECCWMKDAWPVHAKGYGGRHYRLDYVDQNFDTYTTEYTFADGAKLMVEGRNMVGAANEFASYAHGSKGSAVISKNGHSPARCKTYADQSFDDAAETWRFPDDEPSPYRLEWNHLIAAIRNGTTYNEVDRGAMASLVTAMGRFACHTAGEITLDAMLHHDHEFAPGVDQFTDGGPAPLVANEDGTYPVPLPGLNKKREY